MRTLKQIVCSLLLVCNMGLYAQENQSYFLHTIEKGQSLYSIASMYGVDRSEIIGLNPGSEERIYTGKTLRIPRKENAMQQSTFHTIAQGETLYRLSVKYGVTAADICRANPGLSAENFRIGEVIRIPAKKAEEATAGTQTATGDMQPAEGNVLTATNGSQTAVSGSSTPAVKPRCRDMHKVKRRETIYSISRQYGISEAELIAANPELQDKKAKLKRGSLLCIPYSAEEVKQQQKAAEAAAPTDSQIFNENRKEAKRYGTIKAAIILPFLDGVPQGEAERMVEYYEGFLLAVQDMKKRQVNIDLYTYNSGPKESSIQALLAKKEMKEMDIIFGPLYQQHIAPLADFAKKHHIRLVIPFTSKDNTVFQNPYVYQINTPQSYLYSEAHDHFLHLFPGANVIFIDAKEGAKEKEEFISGLKEALRTRAIPSQTLPENATVEQLRTALRTDRNNIFIPMSGSNTTLLRILPTLTQLVRETAEAEKEKEQKTRIQLFGYPEWQTYTTEHLDAFFELDTYFYSSFYTNNLLPSAVEFTNKYRSWYGKEMDERYPKYGMLGYDTGYYFLSGLARYGSEFEEKLSQIEVRPIQTGFKFERVNNWGGFINRKVFFVHFTKQYELVKLDFE